MRNYKGLAIPDRRLRDDEDLWRKQENYCHKSNCASEELVCNMCLFFGKNIKKFEEWYLSKNKKVTKRI